MMLKRKSREEPQFWLFLGEHQNLGGFATTTDIMLEVDREQYEHARIYGDPDGDELLWVHFEEDNRLDCGCIYHTKGWRNPNGSKTWQRDELVSLGNLCENFPLASGVHINHQGSIQTAKRRFEQPKYPNGGFSWSASGTPLPKTNWLMNVSGNVWTGDNGDPIA